MNKCYVQKRRQRSLGEPSKNTIFYLLSPILLTEGTLAVSKSGAIVIALVLSTPN